MPEAVFDWCSFYSLFWNDKGLKCKVNIPDTVVFRAGRLSAWWATNKEGFIQRHASHNTTLETIRQVFLNVASEDSSNYSKFVSILRKTDGRPQLIRRQAFSQFCEMLSDKLEVGHNNDVEVPLVMQSFIQPYEDLRYITTYFNHGASITSHSFQRKFSRRYCPASGWSASRANNGDGVHDAAANEDTVLASDLQAVDDGMGGVSDPVHGSVDPLLKLTFRKLISHVVKYIQKAHGLTLSGLVCEWIRDASGRIFLLSVLRTEWASNARGNGASAVASSNLLLDPNTDDLDDDHDDILNGAPPPPPPPLDDEDEAILMAAAAAAADSRTHHHQSHFHNHHSHPSHGTKSSPPTSSLSSPHTSTFRLSPTGLVGSTSLAMSPPPPLSPAHSHYTTTVTPPPASPVSHAGSSGGLGWGGGDLSPGLGGGGGGGGGGGVMSKLAQFPGTGATRTAGAKLNVTNTWPSLIHELQLSPQSNHSHQHHHSHSHSGGGSPHRSGASSPLLGHGGGGIGEGGGATVSGGGVLVSSAVEKLVHRSTSPTSSNSNSNSNRQPQQLLFLPLQSGSAPNPRPTRAQSARPSGSKGGWSGTADGFPTGGDYVGGEEGGVVKQQQHKNSYNNYSNHNSNNSNSNGNKPVRALSASLVGRSDHTANGSTPPLSARTSMSSARRKIFSAGGGGGARGGGERGGAEGGEGERGGHRASSPSSAREVFQGGNGGGRVGTSYYPIYPNNSNSNNNNNNNSSNNNNNNNGLSAHSSYYSQSHPYHHPHSHRSGSGSVSTSGTGHQNAGPRGAPLMLQHLTKEVDSLQEELVQQNQLAEANASKVRVLEREKALLVEAYEQRVSELEGLLQQARQELHGSSDYQEQARARYEVAEERVEQLELQVKKLQETLDMERSTLVIALKDTHERDHALKVRAEEMEAEVVRLSTQLQEESAAVNALKRQLLQFSDIAEKYKTTLKEGEYEPGMETVLNKVRHLFTSQTNPFGEQYAVQKVLAFYYADLRSVFLYYAQLETSFTAHWPPSISFQQFMLFCKETESSDPRASSRMVPNTLPHPMLHPRECEAVFRLYAQLDSNAVNSSAPVLAYEGFLAAVVDLASRLRRADNPYLSEGIREFVLRHLALAGRVNPAGIKRGQVRGAMEGTIKLAERDGRVGGGRGGDNGAHHGAVGNLCEGQEVCGRGKKVAPANSTAAGMSALDYDLQMLNVGPGGGVGTGGGGIGGGMGQGNPAKAPSVSKKLNAPHSKIHR